MAQCPVCQAEILDDFGLVTCKSCGSSVLIDFDGQANSKSEAETPVTQAPTNTGITKTAPVEYQEINFSETATPAPEENLSDVPDRTATELKLATPDMTELESFGNSEQVSVSSALGSLKFNLYISGLDSVDIRQSLFENIDDAKFGWSASQLMANIKNGELKLEGLTPVKCALLVQRLRSVSVELKWEQYAIQQV